MTAEGSAVSNFSSISKMKESSPTYLFNTCTEEHILIKNDKILHNVAGGQGNAILCKFLNIWLDIMLPRFLEPNLSLKSGEENDFTSRPLNL